MKILRARLLEAEQERAGGRARRARGARRSARGDRSEKIRTYNFPQDRVTDHRAGVTLHKLEAMLEGDLDDLLDAIHVEMAARKPKPQRSGRLTQARRANRRWTVARAAALDDGALRGAAASRRARLDAECLLAHALGVDRLRLYLEFDKPRRRAASAAASASWCGAARTSACRSRSWSAARSSGRCRCAVTKDVLTPRPETETLVEAALELAARARRGAPRSSTSAPARARSRSRSRASGRRRASPPPTSRQRRSPSRATTRSASSCPARMRFLAGSLFEPVAGERFDLVVSNPPYLSKAAGAARPPELAHEPQAALFADEQGLALLRALARGVAAQLLPGGARRLRGIARAGGARRGLVPRGRPARRGAAARSGGAGRAWSRAAGG